MRHGRADVMLPSRAGLNTLPNHFGAMAFESEYEQEKNALIASSGDLPKVSRGRDRKGGENVRCIFNMRWNKDLANKK